MPPVKSAPRRCLTKQEASQPQPPCCKITHPATSYPAAALPTRTEPYVLRTHADKDSIAGIDDSSITIRYVDTDALFPNDAFPVAPPELIVRLDEIMYSVKNHRWLLKYPRTDLGPGPAELAMANFLNRLSRVCWAGYANLGKPVPDTPRQWVPTESARVLRDGSVVRVPGLALADYNVEVRWGDVLFDVQMVASPDDMDHAIDRLSTGASNVFGSQDRLFHLGMAIAGDTFQLAYFDRAGRILSGIYNVHTDCYSFARIIMGITLLDKAFGGKDTSIALRNGRRFVASDGMEYEILETISRSKSVLGRGTTCWRCRHPGSDEDFVIKNTWADMERRHTEGEILKKAQHIEAIPRLVREETVAGADLRPCRTAPLRDLLTGPDRWAVLARIPKLEFRRLVMQPYARPLEEFSSKEEFLGAFRDTIAAHQELYERYDVVHCDISDNNIMLRARNGSLRRGGLLIDFDCAIPSGSYVVYDAGNLLFIQGTLPFMACDLLQYPRGIRIGPWHDLESFLHVLMYMCASYSGPSNTPRENFNLRESPMGPWLEGDGAYKIKVMYHYDADEFRAFLDCIFDPYFDDFKDLVCELRTIIMKCDPDDMVDYEEVLGAFDRCIERQQEAQRATSSPTDAPTTRAASKRKHPSDEELTDVFSSVATDDAPVGNTDGRVASRRRQADVLVSTSSSGDSECTLAELSDTSKSAKLVQQAQTEVPCRKRQRVE
ncbi:kinase-like domain-containing protein [Schizophyllum fasciatum]